MSQAVQLDMEIFQRIKFLMEYDVTKTSSENILVEQVSMVDTSLRKGGVSSDPVKKPVDFSKLPDTSADFHNPKALQFGDIPNFTLDELTLKVRSLMGNWEVATVETIMTYSGVGIPVVLGVNGFWMALEIRQAINGKPHWWSLIFSIIATATVGSQAAWLKPLYKLGGKGVMGLFQALDLLYQKTKSFGGVGSATGMIDDLILLLKSLTPKLPKLLDILDDGVELITKWSSKFGEKAADTGVRIVKGAQDFKNWLSTTISSIGKWITKTMDKPLYKIARNQGVGRETAKTFGGAVRWGAGVGGLGYAVSPSENPPPQLPGLTYPSGSFTTYDSLQYNPK